MMKHILALTVLLVVLFSLFPESSRTVLSETLTIFGEVGTPPVILDSSRDWSTIAVIDWRTIDNFSSIKKSARHWRLRSRYEHQGSGGPATIQIRIRNQTGTTIFTHPWSQKAQRSSEAYSNWFEDTKRQVDSRDRSIVEAKLIAPPRTPLLGTLYAVSMEAWDIVPDTGQPQQKESQVQLASTRLPKVNYNPNPTRSYKTEPEEALDFALSFVDSCITGNLASYYRLQNDTIYSLNDGNPLQKYSLAPPAGIPDVSTIEDYKNRFDYKIYDREIYGKLFPEWFNTVREWIPDANTYLFMGHKENMVHTNLDEVDYLVFLVGINPNGDWKVIARSEF